MNDTSTPKFFIPNYSKMNYESSLIWVLVYGANIIAILISNGLLIYVISFKVLNKKSRRRRVSTKQSNEITDHELSNKKGVKNSNSIPNVINCQGSLSKDVIVMNYFLIFLSIADILVGGICLPLFVVLNFPRVFLPIIQINGSTRYVDNVNPYKTTSQSKEFYKFNNNVSLLLAPTMTTALGDILESQQNSIKDEGYRKINYAYFCWSQIIFTFFNGYSGFASGYCIIALAYNRYKAIKQMDSNEYLFGRLIKKVSFNIGHNIFLKRLNNYITQFCNSIFMSSNIFDEILLIHLLKKWYTWPVVLLTILSVLSSLPMVILTKNSNCYTNIITNKFSWDKIFLMYSTMIGIIIPVVVSLLFYFMSIRHLNSASSTSRDILKCERSTKRNMRAIQMILCIMLLYIMVGTPLTVFSFLDIFSVVDFQAEFWQKIFISEILNLVVSLDRWANVVIIFYFGGNLRRAFYSVFTNSCCKTNKKTNHDKKRTHNEFSCSNLGSCMRPLLLNKNNISKSFQRIYNFKNVVSEQRGILHVLGPEISLSTSTNNSKYKALPSDLNNIPIMIINNLGTHHPNPTIKIGYDAEYNTSSFKNIPRSPFKANKDIKSTKEPSCKSKITFDKITQIKMAAHQNNFKNRKILISCPEDDSNDKILSPWKYILGHALNSLTSETSSTSTRSTLT